MANWPAKYLWLDGDIVPCEEAKVHILTDAVLTGANVFEGIRAYWNEKHRQLYIFKMEEHLDRLFSSMKLLRMAAPYSRDQIREACVELIARNEFREDIHLRPVVYIGLV